MSAARMVPRAVVGTLVVAALAVSPAHATATITFVGSSLAGNGTGAATVTVARPAGVQAGDVLLARVGVLDLVAENGDTVPPPSGWSWIRANRHSWLYARIAAADDPSSWTWSLGGVHRAAGEILAYRGATGVDVSSGTFTPYATTQIRAPGLTTTAAGDLLVFFGAIHPKARSIAPPPGMTERDDHRYAKNQTIESADQTLGAAGATGDRVATASAAARNSGQLVALLASA